MKDLTPDSLEQLLTYLRTVVDDKGERINIKPTHYYTKENMKEINEAFDREYDKYKNSPENKEFVKLKMPTYYIAKHSDEDLQAAVLAEREACAQLCDEAAESSSDHEAGAALNIQEAIRARSDEMKDGIALTSIAHPEGNPVPDEHEINPDSLETMEIHIPIMPEDQLETWMHNMIRACNRSTCDSDINVLKLIQHIENLYEQGRADEREACAQLCEELKWNASQFDCAAAIRGRTE